MAALQVESFSISQEQLDQISADGTQITTRVVYDNDPPAGWMIIADGPLGSVEICPKPCPRVKTSPSQ